MKIIKAGVLPPMEIYTGVCNKCGCEIECYENEVGWRLNVGKYYACPTTNCISTIAMHKKLEGF